MDFLGNERLSLLLFGMGMEGLHPSTDGGSLCQSISVHHRYRRHSQAWPALRHLVSRASGTGLPWVIIPVVRSRLLDRTMLYTAITRGIETVVLVGDRDLINEIVAAAPTSLARNTALHFGF